MSSTSDFLSSVSYFLAERDRRLSKTDSNGRFKYIPLDHDQFIATLSVGFSVWEAVHSEDEPVHFLDAGCGIGDKVLMAASFLDHQSPKESTFTGIDLNTSYLRTARSLVSIVSNPYSSHPLSKRVSFLKQDLLMTDFSRFNYIYFYCPFSNAHLEKQLETKIRTEAQPGTVVQGHCSQLFGRNEDKAAGWHYLRSNRYIWVKK